MYYVSMLIGLRFSNYRSFREDAGFSMAATGHKDLQTNVFSINKPIRKGAKKVPMNLLRTAAVYGANASGKSNFFQAVRFFKGFILDSAMNARANSDVYIDNFRLDDYSKNIPSSFEIDFYYKGVIYNYGFTLSSKKVHEEWLSYNSKGATVSLFERKGGSYRIMPAFKKASDLKNRTRENALFLSVAAQLNVPIAKEVTSWFGSNFNIISGVKADHYGHYTTDRFNSDVDFSDRVKRFIQVADLGICDISVEARKGKSLRFPSDVLNEEFREQIENEIFFQTKTTHRAYSKSGKLIDRTDFNLERESTGTQMVFNLSGPIIDTLEKGKVLMIDEMDSNLHPKIARFIVNLFNSPTINKKKAQLIFSSHNTHLFSSDYFRRDQLWITNKDRTGNSELYSLSEYKVDDRKVRKDASYEKDYLLGKYAGIPLITDEDQIL